MKEIKGRDITGERFNRLVALEFYGVRLYPCGQRGYYWLFQCDCGKKTIVRSSEVIHGRVKSCGCLQREVTKKHGRYQGLPKIPDKLGFSYRAMVQRCYDSGKVSAPNRKFGIKSDWESFTEFKKDMKPSYDRHIKKYGSADTVICRKDYNQNFSKENCFWGTFRESKRNMRGNRLMKYRGKNICLSEYCEKMGISRARYTGRVRAGWNEDELLKPPGYKPLKFRKREKVKRSVEGIAMSKKVAEILKADERFLEILDGRAQSIIRKRFGLDDGEKMTQKDLADIYGLSRERIRQIENEAMETIIQTRQKGQKGIGTYK